MDKLAIPFGGCKLTEEQELLLKAALLKEQSAMSAWEQWKSQIDIETLSSADYALLPQLYQNLLDHQVEDAHLARLKGVYRRNWYANQLQIKQLEALLSAIDHAGIEVIVLGDVALSAYYPNKGTRSISNFNLLLRLADLEKAVNFVKPFNWYSVTQQTSPSIHLQNEQEQSLWVQAHLFWINPQDRTDEMVWRSAVPSWGWGEAGRMVSSIDQFLHLCSRTFLQGQLCQIQGIADALFVLRSNNPLDWMQLITQAQCYQLILPVSNMLMLLQTILQVSVPDWVLSTLTEMEIAEEEWLNYQVWAGNQPLLMRSRVFHLVRRPLTRIRSRIVQLKQRRFPGRQRLKQLFSTVK